MSGRERCGWSLAPPVAPPLGALPPRARTGARGARSGPPSPWPIAGAVFLGGLGGGLVFPILPLLGTQLGIGAAFLGLILSANRITRLFANPFTGALVDRLGGKLPLTLGLALESVATLAYSVGLHLEGHRWWFLAGRGLWGLGSSGLLVGGMAAALATSTRENRGHVTSVVRLAQTLGMPVGLAFGGLVSGLFSDDAAFLSSSLVAALAAVFTFVAVPSRAGAASLGSREGGFAGVLRLARDRRILAVWCANFLVFFALQGTLFATLALLIERRRLFILGLSARASSGLFMAMLVLCSTPVTLLAGRLLDRLRHRAAVALGGLALLVVGAVLLAVARTVPMESLTLFVIGSGMGGLNVPLVTLLGDLSAPTEQGRAFGGFQLFGDAGGSVGPIVGLIAATRLGFYWSSLGVAAVLAFGVAPILLFLARSERPRPSLDPSSPVGPPSVD